MRVYHKHIPSRHILTADSPRIPSQMILTTIDIYEEALPYIECKMRNTIRHEAAHREDEAETGGMEWTRRSDPGRAEPIAEQAETEDCDSQRPTEVGNISPVNVNEVFQRAKGDAGINPLYLADVKAAVLSDDALGMYNLQEVPDTFTGWDGSIYINVDRFFKEWKVSDPEKAQPATFQDDGMEPDRTEMAGWPGETGEVAPAPVGVPSQTVPARQPVPAVEGR